MVSSALSLVARLVSPLLLILLLYGSCYVCVGVCVLPSRSFIAVIRATSFLFYSAPNSTLRSSGGKNVWQFARVYDCLMDSNTIKVPSAFRRHSDTRCAYVRRYAV